MGAQAPGQSGIRPDYAAARSRSRRFEGEVSIAAPAPEVTAANAAWRGDALWYGREYAVLDNKEAP